MDWDPEPPTPPNRALTRTPFYHDSPTSPTRGPPHLLRNPSLRSIASVWSAASGIGGVGGVGGVGRAEEAPSPYRLPPLNTISTSLQWSALGPGPGPSPTIVEDVVALSPTSESCAAAAAAAPPRGLTKSDSTASRRSVRSHKSIRTIGTYPPGALRAHRYSESNCSDATERNMTGSLSSLASGPDPAAAGDIFRLVDLPCGFMIGLDDMVLTADKAVFGFRDIPPGVHLLWVQSPHSPARCGYWYITDARQDALRCKQWNSYSETLDEMASQFEARDMEKNIAQDLPKLLPYDMRSRRISHLGARNPSQAGPSTPIGSAGGATATAGSAWQEPEFTRDAGRMWHQLTDAISAPFLGRITGRSSVAEWAVNTTDCAKYDPSDPLTFARSASTAAYYKNQASSYNYTDLSFLFSQTFVDLERLDRGDPATQRSVEDTTTRVWEVLNTTPPNITTEDDVVAELQFTFITAAHLGNFACMEQWWNLVLKILLRAYTLPTRWPCLCQRLIKTLHAQLVYMEQNVQDDGRGGEADANSPTTSGPSRHGIMFQLKPQNRARLRQAMTRYKQKLDNLLLSLGRGITPEQEAVGHAFRHLEGWFWKHGWDLRSDVWNGASAGSDGDDGGQDDSDEDDKPVIVELDAEGREKGLLSWN